MARPRRIEILYNPSKSKTTVSQREQRAQVFSMTMQSVANVASKEGTIGQLHVGDHATNVTIPTAAFNAEDKRLVFEIYRDGNDASDTLSASAFLQGIMVRGTANKLGGST